LNKRNENKHEINREKGKRYLVIIACMKLKFTSLNPKSTKTILICVLYFFPNGVLKLNKLRIFEKIA